MTRASDPTLRITPPPVRATPICEGIIKCTNGAVTLQGSYNWTAAAANSEDLNLISSPAVAMPGFVSGGVVMHGGRPGSRSATGGLRRILFVSEAGANGFRQLAPAISRRNRLGMAGGGWRRLSPSAELMIDPESGGARSA